MGTRATSRQPPAPFGAASNAVQAGNPLSQPRA